MPLLTRCRLDTARARATRACRGAAGRRELAGPRDELGRGLGPARTVLRDRGAAPVPFRRTPAAASGGFVGAGKIPQRVRQRERVLDLVAGHRRSAALILDLADRAARGVIGDDVDRAAAGSAEAVWRRSAARAVRVRLDVGEGLDSPVPETWIALHAVGFRASIENGKTRSWRFVATAMTPTGHSRLPDDPAEDRRTRPLDVDLDEAREARISAVDRPGCGP